MQILLPFILICLFLNESILDKDPISPPNQIEFREMATNKKNLHFMAKLFAFRKMTKNETNANQADLNSRKSTCATSKQPLTLEHLKKVCGLRKDDRSFGSYNYPDFNRTAKIVNGNEAKAGEWPWQAYIVIPSATEPNKGTLCGGALITDDVILTVAHCFPKERVPASTIKIELGGNYYKKEVFKARHYKPYDKYVYGFYQKNDIGLIWLEKKAKFNCYIAPVCLPFPPGPFSGDKLNQVPTWVAGHGKLWFNGQYPGHLRQVELKLLSNDKWCERFYSEILPSHICVYGKNVDTCQGDSGSSYVIRYKGQWTTVALVSFNKFCGGKPAVGTRVTSFESWIKKNVDLLN